MDPDTLKIEPMMEALPWNPSSLEFSRQEQSKLDYSGWFVIFITKEREKLFSNSVALYAYDAADVIDGGNFATVLEILSFSSL